MKRLANLTVMMLIASTLITGAAANKGNAILGIWLSPKKEMKLKFYRKGATYAARLIWISPKAQKRAKEQMKDQKMKVSEKELKKMLGRDYIVGLRYNAKKNSWEDGKIVFPKEMVEEMKKVDPKTEKGKQFKKLYDSLDDVTLYCSAKLINKNNAMKATLRFGPIKRNVVWTRVK